MKDPLDTNTLGGSPMFGIDDLIGGAIGAVGNLISGNSNAKQARDMYKHRYQWQVADMKKAGLNPALAYGQSAPIPQTQGLEPLGDSAVKGMQSAAQRGQANAARALTEAQTRLLNAQSADLIEGIKLRNKLTSAQTGLTTERTGLTKEEIGLTHEKRGLTAAQTAESFKRQEQIDQQIQESKYRIKQIQAQTDLTRAEALKVYVVMASLQLDMDWQRASWDVRLQTLNTQLQQQGVNLQLSRLDKVARTLGLAESRAENAWFKELGAMGSSGFQGLIKAILMYSKRN